MKPATYLLATALCLGLTTAHPQQMAAPLAAPQSSSQGGVTVKVTPRLASQEAGQWQFSVVLDTHSQDLSDDLTQTSVLVVDGRELRPLSWTGANPGGHHREGVLAFTAPEPAASQVELRVQRPGEAQPRVFRWDGAALRQQP